METPDRNELLSRIRALEKELEISRARERADSSSTTYKPDDLKTFRDIVDLSPNMIFINFRGKVIYVNRECVASMGYSREEFYAPDFDFLQLIHPDSIELIQDNYTRHLDGEEILPYEYSLQTKDGKAIPALITTRLIDYNNDKAILGVVTDISRRKQVEEALRRSEQKYRGIFETATVGIFQTRVSDGKILMANRACVRIFGFDSVEEVDENILFSTHFYDAERRVELVQELRKNGRVDNFEIQGRKRNGSACYFCVSGILHEAQGVIEGVIIDITKRKEAESALLESERKYRSLAENVHVGLYRSTPGKNGRIIEANAAFLRILGYSSKQELRECSVANLYRNSEEREKHMAEVEEKGAVVNREIEMRRKDGTVIICSDSTAFVIDELSGEHYFDGILEDIMERKKAENVMTGLYAISRAVNNAPDLTSFYQDIQASLGRVIDTGNFFIALYDPESDTLHFPYYEDEKDDSPEPIPVKNSGSLTAHVLTHGKPLLIREDELLQRFSKGDLKQHGYIPKLWLGVPLRSRDSVIGVLAVQSYTNTARYTENDIELLETIAEHIAMAIEKKRAEEEHKKLHEQYIQAQKMESLGRLAGTVAHDLNHILTGLVTYPDLLLMDIDESDPIRDKISRIKRSGQRAAAIVDELQSISRGSIAKPEVIDLHDVINECIQAPEVRQLRAETVSVEFIPGRFSGYVKGARILILKVLYNLITNAADAMSDGGTIILETAGVQLKKKITGFELIPPGTYIRIDISDTGTGIEEDDFSRIFEPYFTRKVLGRSGTGIGLTVVWNIVKEMGGFFDVSSTIGVGTRFSIYLPVTSEPVAEKSADVSNRLSVGNGEKIMILDDEEGLLELGSDILKKLNFIPVTVSSGEKAVEYLSSDTVDLVLLDILLGGEEDGIDVFRKVRELHPDMPAIVMSGYSRSDVLERAKDLGISYFIKKPFTITEIRNAIIDELQKR